MATTVSELKWLKGLLRSLGVSHSRPMQLFCDSETTMHIAANQVFDERTKHIEVDCYFVRDETQSRFVATTGQLADVLTKVLGKQ